VDNFIPGVNAPFTGTNFEEGGYIAAKYLIERGHKHIALALGPKDLSSTPERLAGIERALKESGLPLDGRLIRHGDYTPDVGRQMTEDLLKNNPGVTAVLCANTDLSEGAAAALAALGKKIPDDISLMDFGGDRFTAVNQKNDEIGQTAAKTLLKLMTGEKITGKIIITPGIISRNSVKEMK
jgi:LacI family purine nucleotide synthesis repressor